MRFRKNKYNTLLSPNERGGFTLIELIIVVVIVIIMSGVSVPFLRAFIVSQHLQEVSWQLVQDLRTVKEDAILYQQDLNVYFDYNNSPVEPFNAANRNNRSYLFETFQHDNLADPPEHYIPTDSLDKHFTERVLKYGIVIDSISLAASFPITIGGEKYFVICFRSGAESSFRGEGDVVTAMTNRKNIFSTIINENKLVIKLKDPSTEKAFYVIVEGTGKISMYGSPP